MVQATLDRYAELTRQVKGAQLIVWPETAAPFFFLRTPDLSAQVQAIAKESGGSLLFGAPAWELTADGESYFNRAYLLSPQGEVLGYYDKAHLVPFGEYVPLRRYPPLHRQDGAHGGRLCRGAGGGHGQPAGRRRPGTPGLL